MKIPDQLVLLGEAIELDSTHWQWTWNLKDKMRLYSDPIGKTLVLLSSSKLKRRVKAPFKGKSRDTAKAKSLYLKFQAFKAHTEKAFQYSDGKLVETGKAFEIVYQSNKWGDKNTQYVHMFDSKPKVYVDEAKAPKVIVIKGGKLKLTARGIEG